MGSLGGASSGSYPVHWPPPEACEDTENFMLWPRWADPSCPLLPIFFICQSELTCEVMRLGSEWVSLHPTHMASSGFKQTDLAICRQKQGKPTWEWTHEVESPVGTGRSPAPVQHQAPGPSGPFLFRPQLAGDTGMLQASIPLQGGPQSRHTSIPQLRKPRAGRRHTKRLPEGRRNMTPPIHMSY